MIYRSDGLACGPAHALGVASADIRAFYDANWARPIALNRADFYDWQFAGAPESGGLDHVCVAVKDDVILGAMGLNPRSFRLRGETGYAAELTTWVVSEAARGKGVGRGIMTSLQGTFPLLFGLGISDEAMQIYTMAGFRHLRYIPRYFRILDLEAVRGHAQIAPLGERLVKAWRPAERAAHTAEPAGAADLAACEPALTAHCNHFVRDEAALAWRYEQHPAYRYESFVVRSDTAPGSGVAVVLRHDAIDGLAFTHVMDLFGDPADMAAGIAFAEAAAQAHGSAFVDFYCTATATASAALAAGWFSTNDDYFFQLSHLFYPPEFRPVQTTSAVMWANHSRQALLDLGRLYLSKEDMDLDRPTLAFYEAQTRSSAAAPT